MRHWLFLILLLAWIPAHAQVYKWVDENGVVHYTDRPPAKNAEPAKLPPLQTYKGDKPPKLEAFAKPVQKPATGPIKIKIASPAPDETLRGEAEGQVTVSVLVSPALGPEQYLVYFLNGAPQGIPTRNESQLLENLERGSHNIAVAVVEGQKEISRSETVTIHMKPVSVPPKKK